MAIKEVKREWSPCQLGYVKTFLLHYESDLQNVPRCSVGSKAIVSETDNEYVKTVDGWKLLCECDEDGGTGGGGTSDAVQYIPQELTESQQMQARKNLGVYWKDETEITPIPPEYLVGRELTENDFWATVSVSGEGKLTLNRVAQIEYHPGEDPIPNFTYLESEMLAGSGNFPVLVVFDNGMKSIQCQGCIIDPADYSISFYYKDPLGAFDYIFKYGSDGTMVDDSK